VHFSAIAIDGYQVLAAGQRVRFVAEAGEQDGFRFRAVKVWTGDEPPGSSRKAADSSGAFRSSLDIAFDEPR